jgi:type IV secretory pathway VirB6-like protein
LLAIIALYVMFKLFISLVKCYISIVLSVIFGPIQIMLGVLPGTRMGFGGWLRNLFANIAVFPVTALFMLLGWVLVDQLVGAAKTGQMWSPPVIHSTGGSLLALISFGMLLIVHKVPDMVKEALQVKPFPYGTAIGEALGPLRTPTRMAALYPIQYGSQRINEIYQQYSTGEGQAPPWVARAKALADVMRSLGIVK